MFRGSRSLELATTVGCSLLAGLLVCGAALAEQEQPDGAAPARKPAPAASKSGLTAKGIRRDPKGVKGLSPLMEAMGKGDSAVAVHDFETALSAYRQALTLSPESGLLHYRIAEAQALKGDFKEAESEYGAALRLSGDDLGLKAKILFCLADLAERQRSFEAAVERYTTYETFAPTAEKAVTFPASAAERKKRISEWQQLAKDSADVKARIDKREKEAGPK
jgi:tetratricopeptide (TPR) repeat protein